MSRSSALSYKKNEETIPQFTVGVDQTNSMEISWVLEFTLSNADGVVELNYLGDA